MTVNEWLPNPGTGVNPVREGETLVAYMMRGGHINSRPDEATNYDWRDNRRNYSITHYRVSPPRIAEPATMSADEVKIRAREAAIEAWNLFGEGNLIDEGNKETVRNGSDDDATPIRSILVYERDRAKPLAEVAPHTAEDPDERAAYDLYAEQCGINLHPWEDRHASLWYRSIRAGIKRGRELERGE